MVQQEQSIARLNQTNSGGCWTERNVLRNGRITILCRFSSVAKPKNRRNLLLRRQRSRIDDVRASVNPGEDGSESKVVISTLKLIKPVDPELYRHLTGKSAL